MYFLSLIYYYFCRSFLTADSSKKKEQAKQAFTIEKMN